MSGGSYDYLYSRAPEELRNMARSLDRMADQCDERAGGGPDVSYVPNASHPLGQPYVKKLVDVSALAEVAKYLRVMSFKISRQASVLETWSEVLHDIEWWCSGDTGPDAVVKSFDELPRLPAKASTP
jgi:hypothetical protein